MQLAWKKFHPTLKAGIWLLIIGSGPFLIVMDLDGLGIIEAGNLALGTGPIARLTFIPSLILILLGIFLTRKKDKISKLSFKKSNYEPDQK
ncbi:hypothetical protein AAGF08_18900 [Algoriphagus sp. SE2]|uniref:hypothetical protein n=1 Tax=Algoriphagus sp. SE2 TaxID=3141536 RepID=UPI0031CD12B7